MLAGVSDPPPEVAEGLVQATGAQVSDETSFGVRSISRPSFASEGRPEHLASPLLRVAGGCSYVDAWSHLRDRFGGKKGLSSEYMRPLRHCLAV